LCLIFKRVMTVLLSCLYIEWVWYKYWSIYW